MVASITTSYGTSQTGSFTPFYPGGTGSPVVPRDWVQFSDASSSSPFGITGSAWEIASAPAGSTDALQGSGATVLLQPTQLGDYTVSVTVTDALGCSGTTEVTVSVVSVATVEHPVSIVLTWPETCGDLDLHYLAPSDVFCSATELNYADPTPDWGCATSGCGHEEDPGGLYADGTAYDDPTIGADANWGSGPESVSHPAPFDSPSGAPYEVWVYYYSQTPDNGLTETNSPCGATHPQIVVSVSGTPVATYTLTAGMTTGQVWHAANVAVSRQGSAVTASAADSAASTVASCQGGGT